MPIPHANSEILTFLDKSGDFYYRTDKKGRIIFASQGIENLLGVKQEQINGIYISDLYVHPYEREQLLQNLENSTDVIDIIADLRRKDGDIVTVYSKVKNWFTDDGEIGGVEGITRDISQFQKLNSLVINEEAKSTAILNAIQDGVYIIQEDRFIFANESFVKIIGLSLTVLMDTDWRTLIHEEEREEISQRNVLRTHGEAIPARHSQRLIRPDGEIRNVQISVEWVKNYPGGPAIIGTCKDMTETFLLEEQLRQSQKMEAVGQLTGGIAHDFNNLLAVVQGNISLLKEDLGSQVDFNFDDANEFADESLSALEKGADLTQRLLAFSRRQSLQLRVTSLVDQILDMTSLLEQSVGESVYLNINHILSNKSTPNDYTVKLDRSQFESALLNLAVNAKHAMPEGGNLTIRIDKEPLFSTQLYQHPEIHQGDFIIVSVIDNGSGMNKDIVNRAFEPFFTTKDTGEGSGLGLSMVYGFTKQSGGFTEIISSPEKGTTIKLYFPYSSEIEISKEQQPNQTEDVSLVKHTETILVVEDNKSVRRTSVKILSRMGYTILEAENAPEAIELIDSGQHIDLVFSDIVMPYGMSGIQLAQYIQKNTPHIKCLLTSGYTVHNSWQKAEKSNNFPLIKKPYTPQLLGNVIHRVLTDSYQY